LQTRIGLAALAAALGLATPAWAHDQKVAITFAAVAGDQPVSCGTPIAGLGTTGAAAQLADLRFFVSDVRLLRRDGRAVAVKLAKNAYQVTRGGQGVTLIDLEDATGACAAEGTPATNALVRGTVPHGEYRGVRWTLGVPSALNHTDSPASPAPLNSAAMGWSWQSGRKFTKIELTDPGSGTPWASKTFFVHLGSAGCTGNPATGKTVECAAPNRPTVKLKRFDPAEQVVAVDVKALTAGDDVTATGGCMSMPGAPECAGVFGAFGLGGKPQTLFRAIDA